MTETLELKEATRSTTKLRIEKSKPVITDMQSFLYKRALFGLSVYTPEEIDNMHWDKRKRIIKVHKRAQAILNQWKQEIVIDLSNHLLQSLFPSQPLIKQLVENHSSTDPEFINKMTFKELRITKDKVIDRLISEGVLPTNFRELPDGKKTQKL